MLPSLKPHQSRGIAAVESLRSQGRRAILAVAPPGGGKSRCMLELAKAEVSRGGRVMIKAHRSMLLDQLVGTMGEAGLNVTALAPGYEYDESAEVVVAMSQTLFHRAVRRGLIDLPDVSLILNDEAHQQTSKMERSLIFGSYSGSMVKEGYLARGVDVVGFTATPVMDNRIYGDLVDFGSYSELRACNMHQPVHVCGPDEIDTTNLKLARNQEYSERDLESRVEVIFGSVEREYRKLNPTQTPTLLFAPSVASSLWFAQQFMAHGVSAAHIDGERCFVPSEDGRLVEYSTDSSVRQAILDGSKSGDIKVVTNRFVLREAIDMPWLQHCIVATVMGGLTTYLQSVGRLQRFWPECAHKMLQDHGGHYWRHGSPNEDRIWRLGLTRAAAAKERVDKILRGEKSEGVRCPACGFWRKGGDVCYNCANVHTHSVRAVRSVSGRLKLMKGQVYRRPKNHGQSAHQKQWTSALFAAAASNKSVAEAVALCSQKCRSKGIVMDWTKVTNKPPPVESADSRRAVRNVFPWTVRRKRSQTE